MGIEDIGQKGLVEGLGAARRGLQQAGAATAALVENAGATLQDHGAIKGVKKGVNAVLRSGDEAVASLRQLNAQIIAEHPDLARIKFQRMSADPFAFLRGANGLFGQDLARQPRVPVQTLLQGDAHLLNYGTFKNPDDKIILYLNDFDDAIHGPFDWDVRRMATSIVLAGKEAGLGKQETEAALQEGLKAYKDELANLADKGPKALDKVPEVKSRPARLAVERAEKNDRSKLLAQWTEKVDAQPRFKNLPGKLIAASEAERQQMAKAVQAYIKSVPPDLRHDPSFYEIKDVAFRVSGTGSVGNRSYYVLVEGHSPAFEDMHILQFKQEPAPAYTQPLGVSPPKDPAAKVVEATKILLPGAAQDRYLGSATVNGISYTVRQISPAKGGVDLADIKGAKDLTDLAHDAGTILAQSHARGGDTKALHQFVKGQGGTWVDDVAAFARSYAQQTAVDFQAFKAALAKDPLLRN